MNDRIADFGFGALVATMAVSWLAFDTVNDAKLELAEYKGKHISMSFEEAAKCSEIKNAEAFNEAVSNGVGGDIKVRVNPDNICGYGLSVVDLESGKTQTFIIN